MLGLPVGSHWLVSVHGVHKTLLPTDQDQPLAFQQPIPHRSLDLIYSTHDKQPGFFLSLLAPSFAHAHNPYKFLKLHRMLRNLCQDPGAQHRQFGKSLYQSSVNPQFSN